VLSAISGLKVATDQITQSTVVGISIAVLVLLFAVQRAGTGKISVVFAPVVTVWLLFNASLGFYNLSTNGWGIWEVRATLASSGHQRERARLGCAAPSGAARAR
jgi:K+ transporter